MKMYNCMVNNMYMENCRMNMTFNYQPELQGEMGNPIYIENPEMYLQAVSPVQTKVGSKIVIVRYQEGDFASWVVTQEGPDGQVTVKVPNKNLYMTIPSDGSRYITLQPLGGYGNPYQYFEQPLIPPPPFTWTLSGNQIFISTETKSVDPGTFLSIPIQGQPAFKAIFSFSST